MSSIVIGLSGAIFGVVNWFVLNPWRVITFPPILGLTSGAMILFPFLTSNSTFSETCVSSVGKKVFCKKVLTGGVWSNASIISRVV